MAADGSFFLAGSTDRNWGVFEAGDDDDDMAVLKIAANGTLLWAWQVHYT